MAKWYACPKCGGRQIIKNDFEISNGVEVWQTLYCDSCGFTWNEVFAFSHNEDFTDGTALDEDGNPLDN